MSGLVITSVKGMVRGSVALAFVLGVAAPSWAPTAVERTAFGLVGIAAGQTLQLNVVAFPPNPRAATLGFVDTSGMPLGPPEQRVSLTSGPSASLRLTSQTRGLAFGHRVQVRPVVATDPMTLQGCVATAELVDQASRFTTTLIAGVPPGPGESRPGPGERFGMMGLAPFQTLRLNVVAYPPTPCAATLSFADANGNAVGPTETVGLAPGYGTSLDLSRGALPPGPAERAEVRPVVTLDPLTTSNCGRTHRA